MKNKKQENNEEPAKKTNIVDQETAEFEFERFCEGWEIDADKTNMDEEDKSTFESYKAQFVNAVKKGRLVYNDDETLTYSFSNKSEKYDGKNVTVRRPKGAAYMEMDRYKDSQGFHKAYAVLAAMTGHESKYYSGVDGIDLKPLQAIITLFLAG